VAKARVIIYRREGETAFLNVDVDVRSAKPLEPLVEALGDSVSLHYIGRHGGAYWAHFAPYSPKSADAAVRTLAHLIRRLPGPARRLWAGARERVFDIGIQSGYRPHSAEHLLSADAVKEIAQLGGTLKITVYAVEEGASIKARGRPTKR
jgi:hypothetical protein